MKNSGLISTILVLTSFLPVCSTGIHAQTYIAEAVWELTNPSAGGTGYGDEIMFTTQAKAPDSTVVVAKDGSGDYTHIQAAFDAVPDNYTGRFIIDVRPGVYYEKLLLDRNKVNVVLKGEHPDSVILTYDDYAGIAGGTSLSYSVAIDPDDFTAINITFQNTVVNDGSVSDQQGVALRVNGDRQSYYNCKLLGYQDTYYTWGGRGTGRIYMKHCFIEGSVDFIFGRDIVVFDSCEINFKRNGGTMTAASTEEDSKFGYVFRNCKITTDGTGFDGNAISNVYLGRPWQSAPRTVFLTCEEPQAINPAGWLAWNVPPALYAEYTCSGPGADPSGRNASISSQLPAGEAALYTPEHIFASDASPSFSFDWMPADTVSRFSQAVTYSISSSHVYGDVDVDPGAVSSSHLPVHYLSSDESVVAGGIGTVDIKGVGTAELTATQPGNFLYKAAVPKVNTIEVTKGSLIAEADDKTKREGEENPEFTISYTGFAYGDDVTSISPPSINCEATADSPAGEYPIELADGSAVNYVLTRIDGTLHIIPPSGIEEAEVPGIRVFPNPASDKVVIENSGHSGGEIKIFNSIGEIVYRSSQTGDTKYIDVSRMASGLYLISIENTTFQLVVR